MSDPQKPDLHTDYSREAGAVTDSGIFPGSAPIRERNLAWVWVWIVAVLTLVWLGLQSAESADALRRMGQFGYHDTEIEAKDGALALASVTPIDFVGATVPASGDTLLRINGQPASEELWKAELESPRPIGYEVRLTFLDDGKSRDALIRLRSFDQGMGLTLQIFLIAILAVALFYFAIGLLALIRQGHMARARVLALLNMALAMFVVTLPLAIINGMTFGKEQASAMSWLINGIGVLTVFATGYWLHLALTFPRPSRIVLGRPWLLYALCYLPGVFSLPSELFGESAGKFLTGLGETAGTLMALQFIATMVILWRGRKRAQTLLERQQVKAVVMGVILGPVLALVPIILAILLVVFEVAPGTPQSLIMAVVLFSFCLGLLPIPISFLYAFRGFRLMEVELRLRRGTRFAIVAGLLLIVFFTLLFNVSGILVDTLGVEARTGVLAVGLVLALALGPVQRQAHNFVEQRFFPERKQLQKMLREMLASSALMPDRASMWEHLESGLRRALGVTDVIPLLCDEDHCCFMQTDGGETPFDPAGALISDLRNSGKPIIVEEALSSGRITVLEREWRWLRERHAAILLPMIVNSRLIGFVTLCSGQGVQDLAAEEMNVLASVVSQCALQSEHLRLVEENVEKRRLQEQLEMARQVQERFLPSTLPATPGLEVAMRFHPSYEVAGDYYDVLPLSGGRTLLAVADVSGKGAGAAMIMANVQASLRSMTRAGVPLLEMVSALNESLTESTSPDQFVTFFAAVFDPRENSLTFVNAGHNAPRLIGVDGSAAELFTGGPVLGVVTDQPYSAGTLLLQPGEVLVAFTDGVSEAMNAAGDEFGEDHVVKIVRERRAECVEDSAAAIERAVYDFHGSTILEDDFTMLIAKVEMPFA